MPSGALRVAGLTLVCLSIASCAPTRNFISNSNLWPWEQGQGAPGLTTDLAKPFPGLPATRPTEMQAQTRPAEFDDTHPLVEEYVRRFQGDMRGFYRAALANSGQYVPRITAILRKHGIPTELAYLPLIESSYVIHAKSHANAVGPWQFIAPTGRRYGLRIDHYVDERRDPIKSTDAAARYLKDLYSMFGNWNLAIAAYNTGEGNISRFIERKNAKDYWDMLRGGYLHKETQHYVPRFLAAIRIAADPEAYGFDAPVPGDIIYDWVHVTHPLPLSKIAEFAGTNKDEIAKLNPALLRGVVPRSGYTVKLPKGSKRDYQLAAAKTDPRLYAWNPTSARCRSDEGHHCVQRGETLAAIARRHGVSVNDLMRENGIKNANRLQVGRALYVPGSRTASAPSRKSTGGSLAYRVRSGDTLGAIAARHGTSTQAIMNANGIRNPRNLKVGQRLTIPGSVTTKVAAAPRANTQAAPRANVVHVLRSGETIGTLANRYGVSTAAILRANNIRNANRMQIGQRITIPGGNAVAAQPRVATKAAAAPVPARASSHTVRKGETVGGIANRYGVSTQALLRANGIKDARRIGIGQKLTIPAAGATRTQAVAAKAAKPRTHTVRSGDSPYTISQRYQISVDALLKANRIRNPRSLKPGQVLVVPASDGRIAAAR